jgi:hypothetical protein
MGRPSTSARNGRTSVGKAQIFGKDQQVVGQIVAQTSDDNL